MSLGNVLARMAKLNAYTEKYGSEKAAKARLEEEAMQEALRDAREQPESCAVRLPIPVAVQVETDGDMDPSDLPDELDCANQAFRAVSKGYGDSSATFRKRLLAWILKHRADLGPEARERIATVANRDKAAGRRAGKPK